MSLSKKTYEALATALAAQRPAPGLAQREGWWAAVKAVEGVCNEQKGAGGFDAGRFLLACEDRPSYRGG